MFGLGHKGKVDEELSHRTLFCKVYLCWNELFLTVADPVYEVHKLILQE